MTDAKDHFRASIVLNNLSDVPKIMKKLRQIYPDVVGDAFSESPKNDSGYRGLHLVFETQNGLKVEVQLHTKERWEIKNGIGEEIYQRWRSIPESEMTEQKRIEHDRDMAFCSYLFTDVYAGITPEVRRMASDSVMGVESNQSPQIPSKGTQASPLQTTQLKVESGYANSSHVASSSPNLNLLNGFTEKSAPFVDNSITKNNRGIKEKSANNAATPAHGAAFKKNTVGAVQSEFAPRQIFFANGFIELSDAETGQMYKLFDEADKYGEFSKERLDIENFR